MRAGLCSRFLGAGTLKLRLPFMVPAGCLRWRFAVRVRRSAVAAACAPRALRRCRSDRLAAWRPIPARGLDAREELSLRRCANLGPMLAQEPHRELIHDLAVRREALGAVAMGAKGATAPLALLGRFD